MKKLLLLIFTSISYLSFSQKVKKIVEDDYDCFCKHEYHVLRKDKTIKHGHYKSTWVNGNPRKEGFYHFGVKDSLWTCFNLYKPIVASRGHYKKGLKVDIWEYFDDDGVIMNRYNHTTKILSYSTFEDTVKSYTIRTPDTLLHEVKLERSPVYLEGEKNKFRIIQQNIVYPQKAIDLNIFGTVKIAFYIDFDGRAVDHKIIQKIGGGCDEEALRVVKLIPDEWAPAIHAGHLVEAQVIMPITFQLQ